MMDLLCGHEIGLHRKNKYLCKDCFSFWDLDFKENVFQYTQEYPESKGHYDSNIGSLKVKSFKKWLKKQK